MKFFKQNIFFISVIFLVILAACLRFYNYTNRISLSGDEAGFFLVARHAILTHQLPLLGPFSSAGPFQTGGEWYWLVMIGSLLNLNVLYSPWIFMTLLSIGSVLLAIYIGKITFGKTFGLIFGLLFAVSPSQIQQSIGLTNQTPITFFSLLAFLMGILFLKKKKDIYGFWMTFFIGLAASIHLQGIAIIPFAGLIFIFSKRYSPKTILLFILGFLIPWIPVFISDIGHNFFTFKNMFYYFFLEKNKISYEVLGRRWITFLGIYVPSAWAYVIGGNTIVGYSIIALTMGGSIYAYFQKKLTIIPIIVLLSTIFLFGVVRYTRTPLFDSYIMFLHPFIIFLTVWSAWVFLPKYKIGVTLFFAVVVLFSLVLDWQKIRAATSLDYIKNWERIMVQKYPNEKFNLHAYKYRDVPQFLPLSVYLSVDNLSSDDGIKIGLVNPKVHEKFKLYHQKIYEGVDGFQLYNLESSSSAHLTKEGWQSVTPSKIYDATENWYKKH